MLTIDGSQGEGGGQILRTALALSTCLGRPFRIVRVRANRKRPGLQPQHLAAVKAAATISHADLQGAEKNSQALLFKPGPVSPGRYHFDIGTAGSTSLVLQTVLPALSLTSAPSTLFIEGGTHNPLAPPFEFIRYSFLPLVNRMGPAVTALLERPGFAPRGGGRIHVTVEPAAAVKPIEILERGEIKESRAEVLLSHLPVHIVERELGIIRSRLSIPAGNLRYSIDTSARGPGNLVAIIIRSHTIAECFTSLGKKGLPAEHVAEQAVRAAQRYLEADVPIGLHLADQLVLFLALAGSGSFITMQPTSHALTNMEVIASFTGRAFDAEQIGEDRWKISFAL